MHGQFVSRSRRRHAAAIGAVSMRALIAMLALAVSGPALAQPDLFRRCRINVSSVALGQYSTIDSFNTYANGRVIVECEDGVFPTRVILSPGNSGNAQNRQMTRGRNQISYNLYVDPGHTVVAGDGTQGTSPLVPRLSLPRRQSYPLFGVIPAGQAVEGGEYSDTLIVELEF